MHPLTFVLVGGGALALVTTLGRYARGGTGRGRRTRGANDSGWNAGNMPGDGSGGHHGGPPGCGGGHGSAGSDGGASCGGGSSCGGGGGCGGGSG
jgi:hypothetical protein